VVFSPPSNSTLSKADELYAEKYSSSGKIFEPITPHFDTQSLSGRESKIVDRLKSAFQTIFPTDVLSLEQSESTTGSKDPSIAIAYSVTPSGITFVTDDEDRIFVGIDVGFDMTMAVPDGSSPFDFTLTVSPPKRFGFSYDEGGNQAEAAYNAMAERAFDEFTTKLKGVFFASDGSTETTTTEAS